MTRQRGICDIACESGHSFTWAVGPNTTSDSLWTNRLRMVTGVTVCYLFWDALRRFAEYGAENGPDTISSFTTEIPCFIPANDELRRTNNLLMSHAARRRCLPPYRRS